MSDPRTKFTSNTPSTSRNTSGMVPTSRPSSPTLEEDAETVQAKLGVKMAAFARIVARAKEAETCPLCNHEWERHDPEDGGCDAHSAEPGRFGVCGCGRSLVFWAERNAALSRQALGRLQDEPKCPSCGFADHDPAAWSDPFAMDCDNDFHKDRASWEAEG